MNKAELDNSVGKYKTRTKNALQTIFDALAKGQRKKILKNPEVAAILTRYGVDTTAAG